MKRLNLLWVCIVCLMACAPAVSITFQPQVNNPLTQKMIVAFKAVFTYYQLQVKEQASYQYDGTDERAFLLAIDQFYLANPGFCPMNDGFHVNADGTLQMTLAAKKEQVIAFIYDLRNKPKFVYVIVSGISQIEPPTRPCRNGN